MSRFIFILFTLLATTKGLSQNLLFEHLKVKDGLSQATVNDIYQDEFNQIWIATRDGLNKYDGDKITVFNRQINDSTGLFGNNINSVCGDRKGKIFIGCKYGLVIYNQKEQDLSVVARKEVRCMHYGKDRLWIGATHAVNYLTPEQEIRTYVKLEHPCIIRSIFESSNSNLYVGTDNGLLVLDRNGKTTQIIKDINVVCLYEDKQKRIWAGTLNDGLLCIDTNENITFYKHEPSNPHSISNNYVRAICQDDLGYFWIGTFNGLDYFDPTTKEFRNYNHSFKDNASISDFSIWCIEKDIQGNLWIGTYFGGVDIINPEYSFANYYRAQDNGKGLNSSIVSNIAEEPNGNLWICTDNAGLNYFDRQNNRFSYYTQQEGLSSNTVKAILPDEKNNCLWIGSHLGGLDRMNLTTRRIERITLSKDNKLIDRYVRCILPYDGKLLIGTHALIQCYDPQTGQCHSLLPEDCTLKTGQVWDMQIDHRQNLWFSIQNAVFRFNLQTRELTSVPQLDNIDFAVFFEDSKQNLWIGGAGSGLFQIRDNQIVRTYNTDNSKLVDNYILDIAESKSGYLLIATNKGLTRLDTDHHTFYNYLNNVFFPFESLNERCIFVSPRNGTIALSSTQGLMLLSEKDLLYRSKTYNINLTSLSVNNKVVLPNDPTGILQQSILYADRLTLQEKHNVVSIDFAVTNYIKALQPEVEYMLEGFDNEWVKAKSNTITYTNLNPGTYQLKLRSKGLNNPEEVQLKTLSIQVKPYFYKTWYAYIVYLLVLAAIAYSLYVQFRLKNSLKYAAYKAAQTEESNQSKLRFFINVSHEIRTPVTLILAQIDYMLQGKDLPQNIQNRMNNMKRNAVKLKQLINELLDFRKQEQSEIRLKVSEQNFAAFAKEIYTSFQDYANAQNISTSFICNEKNIPLYFDPIQMTKVLNNLISNALKFTPAQGNVSVIINAQRSNVEVSVKDNGIGIKADDISKIFNRFYQAQESQNQHIEFGVGIGLSLVKNIIEAHHGRINVSNNEEGGTTFTLSLPTGRAHFAEEQIYNAAQENTNLINNEIEIEQIKNELQNQPAGPADEKKYKVLIVEDNEDMRNMLIDIFTDVYDVSYSINGEDIFDKVKQHEPDIILLDIMLPTVSGIELCKMLKSNLSTRSIPVILLTAASTQEKKMEGLQTGADDYITKPFDLKELVLRCNNLIYSRESIKSLLGREVQEANPVMAVSQQDQQFINKATEIVLQNISNPDFNINILAQELCLGRSSLFTKLKEVIGQTPKDFILEIRLRKSTELLKDRRDIPITEISTLVGFSDASYFIKLFKSHYGITPNQYRNNLKK